MRRRTLIRLGLAIVFIAGDVACAAPARDGDEPCKSVASLRLPRTTLEAASIAAGHFQPDPRITAFETPGFCRVSGVVRPTGRSHIGFELWLPRETWNGRLKMLGNGGYSSALPWYEMVRDLNAGYAVVATDTGHTGEGPEFGIGNPEAIRDWGNRAVHLAASEAKQILSVFYGRPARYAYFQGCSTGGHQALMEAQRFPDDFDGIIAGAPGHNRTHLNAGFLWQFMANHTRGESPRQIIPASKLPLIAKAAFTACRAQNGGAAGGLASDGWLNDPLACDFDPAALACQGADAADCLTTEQIAALRRMYAGAHNPRSGARIYFGWPPGSESAADESGGWHFYWADPANSTLPARNAFWQHWVFRNPRWDWQTFDFDRDMAHTDRELAPVINAMDPDLEKFRRHGGKLIQYHGMVDPVVPFADSISYRQRVVLEQKHSRRLTSNNRAEARTAEFYRLFLAPGLGHCRGGPGAAPTELQRALEDWVERGTPPERILATRNSGGVGGEAFERPLCPYPRIARYDGHGAPNVAASFACVAPEKTPVVPQPAREYLN